MVKTKELILDKRKDAAGMTTTKETVISNSVFQWVSLMVTLLGIGAASILYIGSIKEQVSLNRLAIEQVQRDQIRFEGQFSTLQKIVTDGMTLRIQLQAETKNMKDQLDRIEQLIQKHIELDKVASADGVVPNKL